MGVFGEAGGDGGEDGGGDEEQGEDEDEGEAPTGGFGLCDAVEGGEELVGFVGIHAGDFRDGGDWDDPADLVGAGDAGDVVLALEDEGLLGLVMDDEGALIGDGGVDLFRIHFAVGVERGSGVEDEGEDENPEGEAGFHGERRR